MEHIEREKIQDATSLYIIYIKVIHGIRRILTNRKLLAFSVSVVVLEFLLGMIGSEMIHSHYSQSDIYIPFLENAVKVFCLFVVFLVDIVLLVLLATPLKSWRHKRGFQRIGLVNRAQQPPVLLSESVKGSTHTFEYFANGIPWTKFDDEKEYIEATLNLSVVSIYQGKDKTRVMIVAKDGSVQLPDYIEWSDDYLLSTPSKIILGKSLDGLRIVDLDQSPHIQCGCSTGGGKTVLLKCVLHQLEKNGVEIYLCDFKSFVDFPSYIRKNYHCIDTKESLRDTLALLIEEMEYRKKLFSSHDCANISVYNQKHPNAPINRIFLASDEIAYAFQKKGLPTKEKALVEEIEAKMSLLLQQARFAGINIWVSTQRGDADTIPPQVRSNLTTRVCGRASEVLSRVTVDNTLASKIPEHLKGRFVDDNEEYFQAFYYED